MSDLDNENTEGSEGGSEGGSDEKPEEEIF
jgi:hypothetical protein